VPKLCLVNGSAEFREKQIGSLPMSTTDSTRRTLLGSAAMMGTAALAGFVAPASAQTGGKTFVLVHGAWHGGWCWRSVADRLTAKGHKAFTPTMTGLGERSHLLDAKIGLATHITDIVNVINWEGLTDIVLVGHSYGGIIITGVAEQAQSTISSIVFLDAFVPKNGQSLADTASQSFRDSLAAAVQKGEFALAPVPAAGFRVNEKDRAWVDAMCTPHPLATFTDKAIVTGARDRIGKKTYIRAKGYPSLAFDGYQAQLEKIADWRVYELPCGHDAMVDLPAELTDLLLTAA
jgi:pimeloyl-ACP methyl ester carboxylesterase